MNQWTHLGVANSTGRTRLRAVSVRHAIFIGTETMAVHGEGARPVGPGPAGTARFRSPGEWLVEAFIRPVFQRVESPRNSARFTGVCRTQAEQHRQVDPNVAVHASVSGARVSRRVPCRRRLGDSLLDLRARCELRRLIQVLGRRNRPWPGGDRDDRGLEVAERFPRARGIRRLRLSRRCAWTSPVRTFSRHRRELLPRRRPRPSGARLRLPAHGALDWQGGLEDEARDREPSGAALYG